ncbi:MAG: TRAP-type C4-dicarboxylate transport system, periplasmic component [Rhodobacteraceae bacterium HLUCCA12]|nr:MAG: TRAP-type C4-dicarboxylate transport system, periplasmic component [Rhodobacteraceae bacterium HLUCCA12]
MKLLKSAALLTALTMSAPGAFAQELRMLSSWDENYAYNPYILEPFYEGVSEGTDGRITFSQFGPETVPPFEQLEPVGSGAFDLLFTHGAYHFGVSPLMTAADALEGDVEAVRESGIFDVFDEHYQQFNLKLIMLPITPEGAYHIFLRDPVSEEGDLEGRRIRGTLTYSGVIEMLGGVVTVLSPSEIYTALERGVVDGASWPIIGMLDYSWYEVAPYLLRPAFGVNYEPIFMNLDRWNSLSEEDQEVILEVARDVEDAWYDDAVGIWEAEEAELIERGAEITEMGDEQQAQLREAWSEALWAMAEEQNAEATQELRDFAREAGLTD